MSNILNLKKSSILKILLIFTILIILLNIPILHQNLPDNYITHFTILDAIKMDLAEKQFNTLYFITHIF